MNKKIAKYAAPLLMLIILAVPLFVFAQAGGNYGDITDINLEQQQNVDITDTIIQIINWVLGFLALIAIVIILIGGFEWMTAGGSEEKVKTAKTRMKYGFIGLAIVLFAYIIVSFVFTELLSIASGTFSP